MSIIADMPFSSVLGFTSEVDTNSKLNWNAGSIGAFAGRADIEVTTTAAYGIKSGMTSVDEYRYRFYITMGTLSMANSDNFKFIHFPDDNNAIHFLALQETAGGVLQLAASMYNDGFANENKTAVNWGSWSQLEVHCKRGAAGAGFCKVYADGDLVTPVISITGISNNTVWGTNGGCASFRLGAIGGMDAGSSGIFSITRFKLENSGAEIGDEPPPNVGPTADAGANETGTLGTTVNKTDMGGSDTDTNIVSALLESANGTLITVNVGSSGATVTDNGTDTVLIEGDQAEVLAALADVDFDYADPGWNTPWDTPPLVEVDEVISLTLTDDYDEEDTDAFVLAWKKTNGDGTRALYTSGLSLAELNAWLQEALITPPSGVTGTRHAYVKVTSSTPLSDEVIVPLLITAPNQIPVADAGPDQDVIVGGLVQLDGSGSSDPDDDTLTFLWEITEKPVGSVAALSSATIINPTFARDLAGTYRVTLVVNDGALDSLPDEVVITVTPAVPVPVADDLDATFFAKSRVPLVKGDKRQLDGTVVPSLALVWKYPKDLYDLAVDWSGKHVLPGGATSVAGVDVTITDPSIGSPSDVTDTVLYAESVDGLVSVGTTQSGTIGKAYTVRHRTTFDNGRFLNKYVTLEIRNPRSAPHQLFKYPDEEFDVPLLWTGRAPRGATALGAIVVTAYDATDQDVTDDYIALIDGDSGKAVGVLSKKGFSVARITGGVGGEQILLEFAQSFDNLRTFHEYALLTVRTPPA